jgi:three-Cys-motif partner protein
LAYRPPLTAKVNFLFVEADTARANNLQTLVTQRTLPANFRVIVEGGITFEAAFQKRRSEFERNGRLLPTFAFIDPFGWTGVPFQLVKSILQERSCEVFVNFIYDEINRFIGHPDQVANFNSFFGTDAWKTCIGETDPRKRNRILHDLYLKQLQTVAGAKYVRSFEMANQRDVTDYFLFYATSQLLGLKKMKEAMWKADESGDFRFSDATDPNQLVLFEKAPNFPVLQEQLIAEFSGKDVSVGTIEEFVLARTAFRESQYKNILKSLEKSGQLKIVRANAARKSGTFADPNMIVRL